MKITKTLVLIAVIGLSLCIILTGCTTFQVQVATETSATDMPQPNIPNPATVYCDQNGNRHEIQIAADGSQSGVCIFPDGSTCDEWAYFRGECGPAIIVTNESAATAVPTSDGSGGYMPPGTSEAITDWWGVIRSTESGAQYDDFFERQDFGPNYIYFGIDSMLDEVKAQIAELRDSGKIVHLYGTLFSNVPDYNGSQILVERIEVEN